MAHNIQMGNDGFLRVILYDDLDRGVVESFRRDFAPFIEAATPQNPLKTIFFMDSLGKISSTARKYFTDLNADPRLGLVAFINPPRRARVLGKFILRATGKNNIHNFENENQALEWFRTNDVYITST
jgi:hypothetical protein